MAKFDTCRYRAPQFGEGIGEDDFRSTERKGKGRYGRCYSGVYGSMGNPAVIYRSNFHAASNHNDPPITDPMACRNCEEYVSKQQPSKELK